MLRNTKSICRCGSIANGRASLRGTSYFRVQLRPLPAGTARSAMLRQQLPEIAEMGFDIVYLPPIHPIGRAFRKGPNNTTVAPPGAPGSPWAIGDQRCQCIMRRWAQPLQAIAVGTSPSILNWARLLISIAWCKSARVTRPRCSARHRIPMLARPSVGERSSQLVCQAA